MKSLLVEDGQTINYSLIDTSVLNKQVDTYTQIRFYAWDINPKVAVQDYLIQALSQTGTINLTYPPAQTDYFSKDGTVDLEGLEVDITIITQSAEYDSSGRRKTTTSVTDIAESCYAVPSELSEAFADGNSAEIAIYPLGSQLPIYEYSINYLGQYDLDPNGAIDASDAALLQKYLLGSGSIGSEADLNGDECVDSLDMIAMRNKLF
ncbi:MAG: hypothetical protein IJX77_09870 [Ruminococcus sp.]|nr:hypothetical protein [Ruminococcus sp.]